MPSVSKEHQLTKFFTVLKCQDVWNHTVQIISALITSHNAYTSTNETNIAQIKLKLISFLGGDAPGVVHACFDAMLLPQSALKLFAHFTNGADGSKHGKVQKKGDFPQICILYVRVIINKCSFEPFCVWILF